MDRTSYYTKYATWEVLLNKWKLFNYDTTIPYQYSLSRIKNEEERLTLLFSNKRDHVLHPMDKIDHVVATFKGQAIEVKAIKTFNAPSNYIKFYDERGWIFEVPETGSLKRYIFWTDRDIVEVVSTNQPEILKLEK